MCYNLCYWAYFHCFKWPNIEQKTLPSGHTDQVSLLSVTRYWNKKLPKTIKSSHSRFYLKIAQNVTNYLGYFSKKLLTPRTFKNRPIWSHLFSHQTLLKRMILLLATTIVTRNELCSLSENGNWTFTSNYSSQLLLLMLHSTQRSEIETYFSWDWWCKKFIWRPVANLIKPLRS